MSFSEEALKLGTTQPATTRRELKNEYGGHEIWERMSIVLTHVLTQEKSEKICQFKPN
ncbi:MAG: hypothetical protein HC862_16255 [Scytonema sp. RU_4_4]|nr:hypothetical protein [Scytonema sp. RU_4_4]